MNKPTLDPKNPEFNWLTALEWLVENGCKGEEFWMLDEAAADWPTCACGQLCKSLPKHDGGIPKDEQLAKLGQEFYGSIGDWKLALSIFHQIEDRTAYLLSQMPRN